MRRLLAAGFNNEADRKRFLKNPPKKNTRPSFRPRGQLEGVTRSSRLLVESDERKSCNVNYQRLGSATQSLFPRDKPGNFCPSEFPSQMRGLLSRQAINPGLEGDESTYLGKKTFSQRAGNQS